MDEVFERISTPDLIEELMAECRKLEDRYKNEEFYQPLECNENVMNMEDQNVNSSISNGQ